MFLFSCLVTFFMINRFYRQCFTLTYNCPTNRELTCLPQPDILRNLFDVGGLGFLKPGYEHLSIGVITNTEIKNK